MILFHLCPSEQCLAFVLWAGAEMGGGTVRLHSRPKTATRGVFYEAREYFCYQIRYGGIEKPLGPYLIGQQATGGAESTVHPVDHASKKRD